MSDRTRQPSQLVARQSPYDRPHDNTRLGRRAFCAAMLAAAGALPSALALADTPELSRETDLLRALIKMRGSLDDQMVIGWVRAKRFAVSQGRVEPLCGFVAATLNRFRQEADDLYSVVTLEITHYTDFETGELLDRLIMPFTGREVVVPAYRFGPASARFAVRLEEQSEFTPAEKTTEGEFSPAGSVLMSKSIDPAYVRHSKLYLRHEEHGRVYPADAEFPMMFYKESTIWSAPLSDVLDERTKNVDASVNYSAMTSWRPWMDMGDLPGHTTSNGFGGKARSLDDMPEDWLRYTRQVHPDVIEDPVAALQMADESV